MLNGKISSAGSNMNKKAMIFQLGISIDRKAMKETPRENITCRKMIERSRMLPVSSYFKNV